MMKLLSFAAVAAATVSAAEVPVFSSNDDYDEINLNIRLLQTNVTEAPANVTMTYTVTGELTSSYTTDKTVAGLCADVEGATASAMTATTGADSCTVTSCAAPASRARALKTDVSITQAYSLAFSS